MSEPITITLGGEIVPLPLIMNFAMLERVWPALQAKSKAPDGVAEVSAAIAIVAGVLLETRPDLTMPEIKKRLRIHRAGPVDERSILLTSLDELCKASGLVKPEETGPGEAKPPEAPADQTASTSNT